jgi:hypothetical protein
LALWAVRLREASSALLWAILAQAPPSAAHSGWVPARSSAINSRDKRLSKRINSGKSIPTRLKSSGSEESSKGFAAKVNTD